MPLHQNTKDTYGKNNNDYLTKSIDSFLSKISTSLFILSSNIFQKIVHSITFVLCTTISFLLQTPRLPYFSFYSFPNADGRCALFLVYLFTFSFCNTHTYNLKLKKQRANHSPLYPIKDPRFLARRESGKHLSPFVSFFFRFIVGL